MTAWPLAILFAVLTASPLQDADQPPREESVSTRLLDVRWLGSMQREDPVPWDLARRSDLPLDDIWLNHDYRRAPIVPGLRDLRAWIDDQTEGAFTREPESESTSWITLTASASEHRELDRALSTLRTMLRRPVRVGWYRVESDAAIPRDAVLLRPEDVDALRASDALTAVATSTTIAGRDTVLRDWTWRALLVDHDQEELRARPRPDPQVNLQRSGPECVLRVLPEPDGSWDLLVQVQDAHAGTTREVEYPTGRERLQLPSLEWTSLDATARVENGGGLLVESRVDGSVERWLFTARADGSTSRPDDRLVTMGRWARPPHHRRSSRIPKPSPSGGWWWGDGDIWPFNVEHHDELRSFRELLGGEGRVAVASRLGSVVALSDDATGVAVRRSVSELSEQRFPTYRVELRIVREPRASRYRSEVTKPTTTLVRGTTRGGDLLCWADVSSATYLRDTDIEISGMMSANDPQVAARVEGVSAWVRCLPTRRGRVHVTTQVLLADHVYDSTYLDVPINMRVVDYERALEEGGLPTVESDESARIELPQQSRARIRASFVAQPGEWELVGTGWIADTADEVHAYVRVSTERGP